MPMPALVAAGNQFGATMGRPDRAPATDDQRFYLQRLDFVDGGYDRGGAYWGGRENVYRWVSQDLTGEGFFRAEDRRTAKKKLKLLYPRARTFDFGDQSDLDCTEGPGLHDGCPTCTGLLAAVLAAPADDVPRLQLADHLEGDHAGPAETARARFIRDQIALAEHNYDCADVDCCPSRKARCEWYLRCHEEALMQALIPPAGGTPRFWTAFDHARLFAHAIRMAVTFARGFVERVDGPWPAWNEWADHLTTKTPIRRVTLTRDPPPPVNGLIDGRDVPPGVSGHRLAVRCMLFEHWPDIEFTHLR